MIEDKEKRRRRRLDRHRRLEEERGKCKRWGHLTEEDVDFARKQVDTRTRCSCDMCKNSRKVGKGDSRFTKQELQFFITDKED